MGFDNGEVLPGLNESWNFLGANLTEWASGFMVFIMVSLFSPSVGRAMPFMLLGWITTTVTLSSVRKSFPDEERGLRNALVTSCGMVPPGIPAPSVIQPVWSGCPVRDANAQSRFVAYGLDGMFPSHQESLRPAEEGSEQDGNYGRGSVS